MKYLLINSLVLMKQSEFTGTEMLGLAGIFIGGFLTITRKYKEAKDKKKFWLKVGLWILGLMSPVIVGLLID